MSDRMGERKRPEPVPPDQAKPFKIKKATPHYHASNSDHNDNDGCFWFGLLVFFIGFGSLVVCSGLLNQ
jgi:hypothetical protein